LRLTKHQKRVLVALANGWTLKSHRDLAGRKVYRLHSLDGSSKRIPRRVVAALSQHRLVHSNQEFPAATYLLTVKGREVVKKLGDQKIMPLGSKGFFSDVD
jgi:uncharacterized protein YjhX (UPF0386 family)